MHSQKETEDRGLKEHAEEFDASKEDQVAYFKKPTPIEDTLNAVDWNSPAIKEE